MVLSPKSARAQTNRFSYLPEWEQEWANKCEDLEQQIARLRDSCNKAAATDSSLFACKDTNGDGLETLSLKYRLIEGLPDEQKQALEALDMDNNGEIDIDEAPPHAAVRCAPTFQLSAAILATQILNAEQANRLVERTIWRSALALPVLLLCSFGVSLLASLLARTTGTQANALVASGQSGDGVLETAGAKTKVPVALTPLLLGDDMGRITMLSLSNLAEQNEKGDDDPCESCPKHLAMQASKREPRHASLSQPLSSWLPCGAR